MATATSKYLRIYLNDHLAGSTTGTELARRIAQENEGTPLGAVMSELAREIGEDREELRRVMSELGAPENPAKVGMGWAMEKAARLKPNGHVRGYSPLSPFIEVESLSLGIEGKRLLWLALKAVEADRLGEDRLQRLADRAQSQRERLEPLRIDACRRMVAEG